MAAPPLEEIVKTIVTACRPRRIVLFGSRARGEGVPDSDIDLFVEMPSSKRPPERALDIRRLFSSRDWSMDVVVYTPEEVARLRDVVGTLLYTIEREGTVLYEQS